MHNEKYTVNKKRTTQPSTTVKAYRMMNINVSSALVASVFLVLLTPPSGPAGTLILGKRN